MDKKRFRRVLLFGVVAGLIALSPAVARPAPADKAVAKSLQAFRDYYKKGLVETGIVGSSFVLIHDGETIATEHFGYADKDAARPAGDHTIYHWASITKTLTGIAIMQLRDRGLLTLDDPVTRYIPELRQVRNPFGGMDEITIRQLMTHSAGFRSATWPWKDKPWQPWEPLKWEQLAAMFPYTEIEFRPGSRWSYSNPGIIFLGRIIEILTTDDYEVYVDKNILKPLQMFDSYFDTTPPHLLKDRAHSYYVKGAEVTAAPFDVNTGITVSNGGLNAPIIDFAKYLKFLMGDPKKQALYDVVLKRSSLEEMFRPVLRIAAEGESASPDAPVDERQGLLFFLEDHFGARYVCHSGGQNAFATHFYYHPETRTAYAIAFNTYAEPAGGATSSAPKGTTGALDRAIRDHLFQNVFPLFGRAK
ncbi:MAG TPA: serine hydrolase domain-containing protein [Candidatus Aminicenantes bacterium]|nr:serine hydrolase domain-containing protein [Candidatus Aminicenantes bacterium]HRY66178.1 serine hydrolase domain-containing protein [Candidatus Aminicenantes bacterium]HRZ73092.1 serine hydrolase domain-containing protein [Candidatus Aminicenantes bacterium]